MREFVYIQWFQWIFKTSHTLRDNSSLIWGILTKNSSICGALAFHLIKQIAIIGHICFCNLMIQLSPHLIWWHAGGDFNIYYANTDLRLTISQKWLWEVILRKFKHTTFRLCVCVCVCVCVGGGGGGGGVAEVWQVQIHNVAFMQILSQRYS